MGQTVFTAHLSSFPDIQLFIKHISDVWSLNLVIMGLGKKKRWTKFVWTQRMHTYKQCFGSGSGPYPVPGRQKWQLINFFFWSAGCSLLRAEGDSCSLDVLYKSLGISKFQILSKKKKNFSCFSISFNFHFFHFWSSKPWIRIGNWIRIQFPLATRLSLSYQSASTPQILIPNGIDYTFGS